LVGGKTGLDQTMSQGGGGGCTSQGGGGVFWTHPIRAKERKSARQQKAKKEGMAKRKKSGRAWWRKHAREGLMGNFPEKKKTWKRGGAGQS